MSNDADQRLNEFDASMNDNGGNFLLHEMTQDVIEWDESNNIDLGGIVRSPHPSLTSSSVKRGRESNITPVSTSSARSSNSSLFATVKCQLDQSKLQAVHDESLPVPSWRAATTHNTNKNIIPVPNGTPKAEREIDGILKILNMEDASGSGGSEEGPSSASMSEMPTQQRQNKRHALRELTRYNTHPQYNLSSSTSLALRHRKRRHRHQDAVREGPAQQMQQQQHWLRTASSDEEDVRPSESPHGMPGSGLCCDAQSSVEAAPDDFAELLQELATPSVKPPRRPLAPVDRNTVLEINPKENIQPPSANENKPANTISETWSKQTLDRPESQHLSPSLRATAHLPYVQRPYQRVPSKEPPQQKATGGPQTQISSFSTIQTQPLRQCNLLVQNHQSGQKSECPSSSTSSSTLPLHTQGGIFNPSRLTKDTKGPTNNATKPIGNSRIGEPTLSRISIGLSHEQHSTTRLLPSIPSVTTTTYYPTKKSNAPDFFNDNTTDDEYGDLFLSTDDLARIDAATQSQFRKVVVPPRQAPRQSLSSPEKTSNEASMKHSSSFPPADPVDATMWQPHWVPTIQCRELVPANSALPDAVVGSKQLETTTEPATAATSDDDFGEFPSDIDWSTIDEIVAIQGIPANEQNLPSAFAPNRACTSAIVLSSKRKPENFIAAKDKADETEMVSSEEDDFGEFPDDIDFDAIDQVVDLRYLTQHVNSGCNIRSNLENHVAARPQTTASWGTLQTTKRNEREDGDLSFIQFSRYKILNVQDDPRSNFKTVGVAVWTDEMVDDDEEEKRIHRNCKVNESNERAERHPPSVSSHPRSVKYVEAGVVNLGGEWYHTPVIPGDVIHICSLTGKYRTDSHALPITLHTYPPPGSEFDDLILVLHPEMLMTPSIISETSSCNRRAVLKAKLGSTGLTSKAALVGTMRHSLFEACMKAGEFDSSFAQVVVQKLLREKAEALIGCGCSESEIESETLGVLPLIQDFAAQYTTLRKDVMMLAPTGKPVRGIACHPDIRFLGNGVHSVEETIVSAELGLKGDIDAVLETETVVLSNKNSLSQNGFPPSAHPQRSLMCLELKTGHNQTAQNVHMAQLSLYTFMLQSRYGSQVRLNGNEFVGSQSCRKTTVQGAAPGGILLYLNHQATQISHVAPHLNEMKTLMSQRNVVASDLKKASKPRGISLSYEKEDSVSETKQRMSIKLLPAPTARLPDLLASQHSCNRCFSNRECMLYAASDSQKSTPSHNELMKRFTAHLSEEDLEYFRTWDRLIDIEADASNRHATTAWLLDASRRENETGDSVAGLVFDDVGSCSTINQASSTIISFRRRCDIHFRSYGDIAIPTGTNVIVSTDGRMFDVMTGDSEESHGKFRHHLHITKGTVYKVEDDRILVTSSVEDLDRVKALVRRYHRATQPLHSNAPAPSQLLFRIDKHESSVGFGTLRWNLINFMNGDFDASVQKDHMTQNLIKKQRLSWLRDMIVGLKPPTFDNEPHLTLFEDSSKNVPGCDLRELALEFDGLNGAQKAAIQMVMRAQDYALIQGLPGTGKTSTLTFLARLLVAHGRRVVITAYTHSAVDNIMLKLVEKGMAERNPKSGLPPLVRIGQSKTCHEGVKHILHSELASNVDREQNTNGTVALRKDDSSGRHDTDNPSARSLKEVIASARIVGISALSLPRSTLLLGENFDVVIVDEAGQMNQPVALGALSAANSFVLVGDHKQLPPLVNSEIAEYGGYGISMLRRLAEKHPQAVAQLTMQYRMNEEICRVSSEAMYGGLLKCGNDLIKQQLLHLPGFPSKLPGATSPSAFSWLRGVLEPTHPVVFIDTDNIRTTLQDIKDPAQSNKSHEKFEGLEEKMGGRAGGSIVNRTEAILVRYIVEALHSCGSDLASVGVISPFRAQIRVLEENLTVASWRKEGLELSTIDKYQGRDKCTIILSLVRSNDNGSAGRLLQDARRLNVALTRAKKKLILVGSYQTLCKGSVSLKPILNRMNIRNQRLLLPENAIDCYRIP